jgi:hypothetical protein
MFGHKFRTRNTVFLEKTCKYIFAVSLLLMALGIWKKDDLPGPDHYDRTIRNDPIQTPTAEKPFITQVGNERYGIFPLFDYVLDGVIVSLHDSDAWNDISHKDWKDVINIRDLCVVWGHNVESDVYRDLHFSSGDWTCYTSGAIRDWRRFKGTQLSNNHLLADNKVVNQAIKSAEVGDQVRVRGVLASYKNLATGGTRGSSVRRDDVGNGACETVFVREFEIVRKGILGWRRMLTVASWCAVGSALLVIWLMIVNPVVRRRGRRPMLD